MIYRNQFVINCISWCVNILTLTRKGLLFYTNDDHSILRQDVINRMVRLVVKGIENNQQSRYINVNINNTNINSINSIKNTNINSNSYSYSN